MHFSILTLFPDFIKQGLNTSILGRAFSKGLLSYNVINIRDFSEDKNGRVDDYTYGGGAGMLMQAQPVYDAYRSAVKGSGKVRCIYVTPQGRPFTQKDAEELSKEKELVFLCGHYEGIDERVLEEVVTDRYSIGDYVLTGGELPALVMIDSISRLVPGVLGNETSSETESFYGDLLEYPQYTRPEVWRDKKVPPELLTGNTRQINAWRTQKAEELTEKVRPDLYKKYQLRNKYIEILLKDKRNNIQMIEALRRGTGEIISENPFIIYMSYDDLVLLGLDEVVNADELFSMIPESVTGIVCGSKCADELEKDERLYRSCDVYNYVYTENVPKRIVNKDIRQLDLSYADYLNATYELIDDEEYVKERISAGVVHGIFVDGQLAGYIGTHGEGSIGMLYVDERFRHRGLAADLEGFMFNRDLKAGRTPYGQVILSNSASISLQEKVGVYGGDKVLTWLHRKN